MCFQDAYVEDFSVSSLRVVDFDADGHLDLVGVTATLCPDVLSGDSFSAGPSSPPPGGALREGSALLNLNVALGDGTGSFAPPTTLQPPFDHPSQGGLAVADFNGDGHLDIALFAFDSLNLVLLIVAGDGTGALTSVDVQTVDFDQTGDIEHGDLDGDGDPDLAISSAGGVRVLINDGQAHFTTLMIAEDPERRYSRPYLHDRDADGDLDLLILRDNSPMDLLTFEGNGDGTFSEGTALAFPGNISDIGILDPATGDRPSVLVSYYDTQAQAYRLDALEIALNGTLAAPVPISGSSAARIAIGHFDGESRPDVLLSREKSAQVFLGTADAWPALPLELPWLEVINSNRPLGVGDLNEDGVDDLVEMTFSTRLLLSNP